MIMKPYEELMIKLIRSSVMKTEEDFSEFSDFTQWGELFALCEAQSVTGMVYDKLAADFVRYMPEKYASWFKQSAFKAMSFQTVRSLAFDGIYQTLARSGVPHIVLKGEALRQLYPQPESRTSLDEDLLVNERDYGKLKNELELMGFEEINEGDEDRHWVNKKYSVYFEIHFTPFPGEKAYEKWNAALKDCHSRTVKNKKGLVTLSHEDSLIFLILHAAKHFVYSGVGIKQILDIALFMKEYQDETDMRYVRAALKKTKTLQFAAALTGFISEYLCSGIYCFGDDTADTDFTADVMSGGSLGKADSGRVHSANVTSSAFRGQSSIKKILFPPKKRLQTNYPFCKKIPLLLPVAWMMRIVSYIFRGKKTAALKTGGERLRLIKRFGLINK